MSTSTPNLTMQTAAVTGDVVQSRAKVVAVGGAVRIYDRRGSEVYASAEPGAWTRVNNKTWEATFPDGTTIKVRNSGCGCRG